VETIKDRLREIYVSALKLPIDPKDVSETDLSHSLGIDSITALEILVWVEDEFQITIEDEDLSPALLDTLDNLAGYIEQRQQVAV
jgi:acyl carrier protein